MSKHGPTQEAQVRDHACAIAEALGKYSDEMWQTGPWYMTITLLTRALADKFWSGELDDLVLKLMEQPTRSQDTPTVQGKWEPPK